MPLVKIETTNAVYWALMEAYKGKIGVYESFSNPDGHAFGGGGAHGEMFTKWGFNHATIPLMEARTTFDLEWNTVMGQFMSKRTSEKHEYWLYVHEEDPED